MLFGNIIGEGLVSEVVDSIDCIESFLGKDMYEDTVEVEVEEIREGSEEEVEEWDNPGYDEDPEGCGGWWWW